MNTKAETSMLAAALPKAVSGSLLAAEVRASWLEVLDPASTQDSAQLRLAALLGILAGRGATALELEGTVAALLECALPFEHDAPAALDTCGTGGDGLSTFNLSTATALVLAAEGVDVIKHGNRAVSSQCGSADLLEALGLDIEASPEQSRRQLEELHFAFLFAPRYHPALAAIGPLRRTLALRTVVNLAAPLANPARVRRQLVGVSDARSLAAVAESMRARGSERAFVVHGPEGADELLPCGLNRLLGVGELGDLELDPRELGIARAPLASLSCANAQRACRQLQALFLGEQSPLRDALALNVAAALIVAERARDFRDGLEAARASLDSGRAERRLAQLRAFGGKR